MHASTSFEVEVSGRSVRVVAVDWMRGYSYLLADDVLFVPDLGRLTERFALHVAERIRLSAIGAVA